MQWMDQLRSAGGLQATLLEQGPRLATIVLAGLLAIQAGFLVTAQNRGAGLSVGAGPAPDLNAPAPPVQLASIASAHLFGEAQNTSVDANAPQTNVQLLLSGVLAVPDPKRGLAIIGPTAAARRPDHGRERHGAGRSESRQRDPADAVLFGERHGDDPAQRPVTRFEP